MTLLSKLLIEDTKPGEFLLAKQVVTPNMGLAIISENQFEEISEFGSRRL